ncbi:MAG: YdcF family protein [Eubacterium sp.]|nr:YdcF family protein [Eubacterium sp.]
MDILSSAKMLWDYHHMNHKLEKADCIIVLGSHDTRVAERGAEVFLQGYAPAIVFSGYLGALTLGSWERPEAEVFAEIAMKKGVPQEKMLIENKSTNTGENFLFTKQLLFKSGISPQKIIAVQKPYMERRTFATSRKVWPEVDVLVTSPEYSFEAYPNDEITLDKVIDIMVGDLQRILAYPSLGYQIPQAVPGDVLEAYKFLVSAGYTSRLIK